MRLQDAVIGPRVILSFKKPIRVFDRVRRGAATSSGQSRTLAWPSLGHPSQAQLPVRAGYPFLSPGVAPRREHRGSYAWLELLGTSLSIAHRHAVDDAVGPEQQGREKVQTGEKIRAPKPRAQEPTAFQ